MSKLRPAALAAGAGILATALWWRKNPSPCPYWQRFFVSGPHPGINSRKLVELLDPRPGEHVLEVGPGTGHYSLDVASQLGDQGRLEVFDIQQEMLDHVVARAERAGVANVVAVQGDAQALPEADATFDAAFLVTVLGEIPSQEEAVQELARTLKPGGRLVVGEIVVDPHYVSLGKLKQLADTAGLRFDRRAGSPLAYFARFVKV